MNLNWHRDIETTKFTRSQVYQTYCVWCEPIMIEMCAVLCGPHFRASIIPPNATFPEHTHIHRQYISEYRYADLLNKNEKKNKIECSHFENNEKKPNKIKQNQIYARHTQNM